MRASRSRQGKMSLKTGRPAKSGAAAEGAPPGFVKCDICIRDARPWRKYCTRCRKFIYRAGNDAAHVAALKRDYDPVHDVFRCHYTKIALEENDRKSPRYLTFDHVVPAGKEKENLVTTFALYNENKTDMTYEEHVAFCREVVRAHDGGKFDEKVLGLKNWYRMVRRRKQG